MSSREMGQNAFEWLLIDSLQLGVAEIDNLTPVLIASLEERCLIGSYGFPMVQIVTGEASVIAEPIYYLEADDEW